MRSEGANMRNVQQVTTISFRASGLLADALLERARQSGVSVSEYMRSLIRQRVGLD